MRVTVVQFLGSNCDHDVIQWSKDIFRMPTEVVWYTESDLRKPDLVLLPGGFSYGDYLRPGAMASRTPAIESVIDFAKSGGLVLGICNGFQVLVKMGLLPRLDGDFRQEVSLTHNDSGRYENRWVHLVRDPATPCVWLRDVDRLPLPVRHAEGKFVPRSAAVLRRLAENGQLALRYALPDGSPARGAFPANPNGSIDDVAGVCDAAGRVFGLMPHPEAYTERFHHPPWTRDELPEEGLGLSLFRAAVREAAATL